MIRVFADTSDNLRVTLEQWFADRVSMARARLEPSNCKWQQRAYQAELLFLEELQHEFHDILRQQRDKARARMVHEMLLSWAANDPLMEEVYREDELPPDELDEAAD